ncbi:NACHT domain-containing protein [Streptomyces sp. XY152]|uniref:NACHT domain-containing protein n=1 Tax=Streptomyces sp. XY152 TaxID=1415560 RepID=UPI0006ADFCAB|nr:NACHT domain-containing protein [Streptomyces sp. XY152]
MRSSIRPPKFKLVTGEKQEEGPFHRPWASLKRPFVSGFWHVRARMLLKRGATEPKRWRSRRLSLILVLSVLSVALLLWLIRAVWALVATSLKSSTTPDRSAPPPGWKGPGGFDPDRVCSTIGMSCGAVTGVVTPLVVLAASTMLFLVWRVMRIRRYCRHEVKRHPTRYVPTAGSLLGEVVGRDRLCTAIMNNLRDNAVRRPHVVVGEVGTGKTAVLVRLAQKLAEKGAVPIPVQLRDAQRALDFSELARTRFEEIVKPKARSSGEVDRIWRWLRQRQDRIVVLADGLEEALNHEEVRGERDNLIRNAIRKAGEECLPLVIASRPHNPLRAMQAAITELEPLNAEAALEYISANGTWRQDIPVLDEIVEVARMADSPLYMRVARDLHAHELLQSLWHGFDSETRRDSWGVRAGLLDQWVEALAEGMVHPELPLNEGTRRAVIAYVSALACIGLASDRADIALAELDPTAAGLVDARPDGLSPPQPHEGRWNDLVAAELDRYIEELLWVPHCFSGTAECLEGPSMDVQLAATWGTRMGLLQETGRSVRFQHSVLQAYLGSRYLQSIVEAALPVPESAGGRLRHASAHLASQGGAGTLVETYWDHRALREAVRLGGRELLIALTLYSRSARRRCGCSDGRVRRDCPVALMRELLVDEARKLLGDADAAEQLAARRSRQLRDQLHLAEHGSPRARAMELYGTAVEIDSVDAVPRHEEVTEALCHDWLRLSRGEDAARLREAKLSAVMKCGAAARRVGRSGLRVDYTRLMDICRKEPDDQVRVAIAQEVGSGGQQAYASLADRLRRLPSAVKVKRAANEPESDGLDGRTRGVSARSGCPGDDGPHTDQGRARHDRIRVEDETLGELQEWRGETVQASLLPLLALSTGRADHAHSPLHDLQKWIDVAIGEERGRNRLLVSGHHTELGMALAQGFKYAANRRPLKSSGTDTVRESLKEKARNMLNRTSFWYTRLTLVQALALWELPDDVSADQPMSGRGSIGAWRPDTSGRQEHPLVRAATGLAVRALQTRRPERFLWIDEAATVGVIGTEVCLPYEQRAHNLWIPPSTGWSTLDPTAQQLLADVVLLLALETGRHRPTRQFRALGERTARRCPAQFPHCLAKDRSLLEPAPSTAGDSNRPQPGAPDAGRHCAEKKCGMRMCPYPRKVEALSIEFSEVFCLHQRELLELRQPRSWLYCRLRQAPWQRHVPIVDMRRFWDRMQDRARDVHSDKDDQS